MVIVDNCCRYFEFEVLTAGLMRTGWAKESIGPSNTLGDNTDAYVFDGFIVSLLFSFGSML